MQDVTYLTFPDPLSGIYLLVVFVIIVHYVFFICFQVLQCLIYHELTRTEHYVLSGTLPEKCIILIIITFLDWESTCRECYFSSLFTFLESLSYTLPPSLWVIIFKRILVQLTAFWFVCSSKQFWNNVGKFIPGFLNFQNKSVHALTKSMI